MATPDADNDERLDPIRRPLMGEVLYGLPIKRQVVKKETNHRVH